MRVRILTASPTLGLDREAEKSRDRVLFYAELETLWGAAETVGYPWGPIVKLLMLTGQRLGEVTKALWSEFRLQEKTWSLPGVRTKNGKPHDVPLSSEVMKVLNSLPRIGSRLFTPNEKTTLSPSHAKAAFDKAMKDAGTPLENWRFHDLRRSMVTHMAETGILPHVIEAVVNHLSGHKAGVAGVYNKAVYAKEKRAALEAWGREVQRIVSGEPAKVVPLRRKRR